MEITKEFETGDSIIHWIHALLEWEKNAHSDDSCSFWSYRHTDILKKSGQKRKVIIRLRKFAVKKETRQFNREFLEFC